MNELRKTTTKISVKCLQNEIWSREIPNTKSLNSEGDVKNSDVTEK